MKKSFFGYSIVCLVLILATTVFAGLAGAQEEAMERGPGETSKTPAEIRDEIEVLRADIDSVHKAVVANALEMTNQESEAFWPVFNEYQRELSRVKDKRAKLITDYVSNYGDITDEQAESMLKEFLDIDEAEIKVRKSYVGKFNEVLPSRKVVRLYQVENKLNAALTFELTKDIPLMW